MKVTVLSSFDARFYTQHSPWIHVAITDPAPGYHHPLNHMALIYPKTDSFNRPLPVFGFPQVPQLRLWVLPFCLDNRRLLWEQQDCTLGDKFQTKQCNKLCNAPTCCLPHSAA